MHITKPAGETLIVKKNTLSMLLLGRDRVGPLLKEAGRMETLEWLFRETQPMG